MSKGEEMTGHALIADSPNDLKAIYNAQAVKKVEWKNQEILFFVFLALLLVFTWYI